MLELVIFITQTGTLLDSDLLGTLIISYIFLTLILFVAFVNIYSVDRYEFLNNKQECIEFKHKAVFIIMYSKNKHFVSRKTLILELIGYLIGVVLLTLFFASFKLEVDLALKLLGICALIVFIFGCVTGSIYRKTQKNNK